jgi:HAD superfamily hydrolase (TIGR01509 family)
MITTIIFDWGGVIGSNDNYAVAKTLAKKYNLNEKQLYLELETTEDKYAQGEENSAFYTNIAQKFSIPLVAIKKEQIKIKPKKTMITLLKQLKKRDYSIELLSNQMNPKAKLIRKEFDFSDFSHILFSNEIKLRKPKKSIYNYTLKTIKKKPQECLFIDNLRTNIEAAKSVGMKGIVFKNHKQLVQQLKKHKIL